MHETNGKLDASGMAFQALAWALMEEARAERLLSLTGLTPEGLRSSITERGTQAAILSFLEAYEPDLIACAAVIGAILKLAFKEQLCRLKIASIQRGTKLPSQRHVAADRVALLKKDEGQKTHRQPEGEPHHNAQPRSRCDPSDKKSE
jgi:hypothetical protein